MARRGQFILSRIDARNGALGIVPSELDEAIVTNDFLLSRTTFRCSTSSGIVYCQLISVGCAARRHSLKNANARAKAQPIACGGRKINFWRAKSRCRRWRSGGEWGTERHTLPTSFWLRLRRAEPLRRTGRATAQASGLRYPHSFPLAFEKKGGILQSALLLAGVNGEARAAPDGAPPNSPRLFRA